LGVDAAVVYFSPTQINVQAPSNLPLGDATVVVNNNGLMSASFTTTVVQSSPSFFSCNAGTNLVAAAVHLDGTLVGDPSITVGAEVAHPEEVILMYANGLAPSPGGTIVSATTFASPVTIAADDFPVAVLGAALALAGQFQINVQLPSNIPAGNYPLTMSVPNGWTVTSGVTVTLPIGP
jgi:uncharacterized protein (TIGR03437 family)